MDFLAMDVDKESNLPDRDYLELKTQLVIAQALEGINQSLAIIVKHGLGIVSL